ncbi:aliphatic sulfonates family ABC transporter periplasmic ligand-binding protein [Chondrocystis sp. NIES-4102]|nr:aliphatic sulfonates family ABC transporter periplasmic ligand-binding protein [Chondrocystis sp. NIES-4102]
MQLIKSCRSYITLFAVTLLLVVSCSNPATKIPTDTATPPVAANAVRLGYSAWPGWFPWKVAEQQQIFAQNNVPVELTWFDGYLESISALTAQQIDGNGQTLGDTVSSVSGGADQVIVLVNDNSTGNDKIIVAPEINTIADLKGKKVAVEEGTVDHFLLLQGLKRAGLSGEDIELIPLETGKAASAFVAGQVDAVAVFAPYTTQAFKRPQSKELFSSKDFPGSISDHLVFTRSFIDENPQQVQAIVDSWFTTLEYIENNPDQAYQIMAQRAGVSVEEYQSYAEGTKIFTLDENLKAFEPGNDLNSLSFAAKKMAEFLVEVGFTPSLPDTSQLFDPRFVQAYAAKHQNS